ncbi:MAG: YihY/virulence factor BrkB family protein [Gemmatimonadales bacterium]
MSSQSGGWHGSAGGVLRRILFAAGETNIPFLASALTFDALLAGIPFILLVLVGLSRLMQGPGAAAARDLTGAVVRFFPPHVGLAGQDPSTVVRTLLQRIGENRSRLSLYAVPLFIWFSTRLFASARTALNRIYRVAIPPAKPRHFVARFLLDKLWDVLMVGLAQILFLAYILLSAGLTVAQAWGESQAPTGTAPMVAYLGRFLSGLLTFGAAFTLFLVVYRFGAARLVRWRTALGAASFAAVAFELARRIFGIYLVSLTSATSPSTFVNLTAVFLFVIWTYYAALVFLLGGVVAETWAERMMLTGEFPTQSPAVEA